MKFRCSKASPIYPFTLFLLIGCSTSDTHIDGTQYAYVDPENEKRIALLLASYESCDERDQSCSAKKQLFAELQVDFERCIARGLKKTASNVALVEGSAWADGNTKLLLEDVLLETNPQLAHGLEELQAYSLDYVVGLTVANNRSANRPMVEGGGDAGGGILLVGQEWTRSAELQARIFSATSGNLVGHLRADLSSDSGWFVPILLVVPIPVPIPLPPAGRSGNVESASCVEMGEALGRFFSGAGNSYVN